MHFQEIPAARFCFVSPDDHLRLEALGGRRYQADDAEAVAERENDLTVPNRQAPVNKNKYCS